MGNRTPTYIHGKAYIPVFMGNRTRGSVPTCIHGKAYTPVFMGKRTHLYSWKSVHTCIHGKAYTPLFVGKCSYLHIPVLMGKLTYLYSWVAKKICTLLRPVDYCVMSLREVRYIFQGLSIDRSLFPYSSLSRLSCSLIYLFFLDLHSRLYISLIFFYLLPYFFSSFFALAYSNLPIHTGPHHFLGHAVASHRGHPRNTGGMRT